MIVFPSAKINLGLQIRQKRADGFHNIESVLYPAAWYDVLEVLPAKKLNMELEGIPVPGFVEENICLKAYHLIQKDFGIPPVDIYLLKRIPIGAGLGGGSADGVYTLKALNQLFELNLSTGQLELYAAKLGSDCPFFVENKPSLVSRKGDVMESIELNLPELNCLIVYPNLHISTIDAYRRTRPDDEVKPLKSMITKPIETWKDHLKNDFEDSLGPNQDMVQVLKEYLYNKSALYAAMSGSGSSVFGLFSPEQDLSEIESSLTDRNFLFCSFPLQNFSVA